MHLLPITRAILAFAISYLIGSIPMGFIVARIAGGIDIREHGSGNIGLTNVIRTLGWGPGFLTGVLDFLKGYAPLMIVIISFSPDDFGSVSAIYELIVILVAILLILGNLFPVYLLFKGGKGVATGMGVLSALLGVFIFIPLAVFGIFLFIFRIVSVSSIAAAVSTPLTVLFLKSHIAFTSESNSAFSLLFAFTMILALLVIWRHKANLVRLFKGTEPRIGGKSPVIKLRPIHIVDASKPDVNPAENKELIDVTVESRESES